MSKRFLIAFVVVWTAAIGLAGFSMLRPDGAADPGQQASSSGGGQTQAEQQTSQQASGERGEKGREAVAKSDTASNGSASNGSTSGGSGSGEVTLKLGGEPGAAFSGRCVVDGEERQISGETPQTFTYEPDKKLECEITSQSGPLRIDFSDGRGTNTTQTVGPGPSTLKLTYTGDSLSSSTSSQAGSSQTGSSQTGSSQTSSSQTNSSQTNSSQSIIQQSSSSVTQSGAE